RKPPKRPPGRALVLAVDADGVVRARTPKPIALSRFAHIGVSTWIDQNAFASGFKHDAQGVRMAVPRPGVPEWPTVHLKGQHLVSQEESPAIREVPRRLVPGWLFNCSIQNLRAQPPSCLLRDFA